MWPGGFLGNARPSGITLKQAAAVFMAVCSECDRVHGEDSASNTLFRGIGHVTPLADQLGAFLAGCS